MSTNMSEKELLRGVIEARREKGEEIAKEVSCEEGILEVSKKILKLLQKKDLVTLSVYGIPNSGKSYLAKRVMEEVRKTKTDVWGGEVKGYDEIPQRYREKTGEKWVMLIQYPLLPAEREVNAEMIKSDTQTYNMPDPDGAILMYGSGIEQGNVEKFKNCVDLIIVNPQAKRK